LKGIRATFAYLAEVRAAVKAGKPIPSKPGAAPEVAPATASAPATAAPKVVESTGRGERRIGMSIIRMKAIQRIKETQNTAALLTTFQEADLSAALELRTKYKEAFPKKHGVQLGLLSLIAKATSHALSDIPEVNAFINDEQTEVIYRDYNDISVPIPTPRGPVNCVLHNVNLKSVVDVEKDLADYTEKARTDALGLDDLTGATFGISDAGVAGGMLGTNMINHPMSAILGTNEVKMRAAVVGGKVVARPIMLLSLTYDHRLVDGREAVQFLCGIRDKMEDPSRLLLDL
jgi:2-oxoglutarate dehydrogenase E2 component (dihydrolipoamide succinyltransferase)